jgi:hypothetical protein
MFLRNRIAAPQGQSQTINPSSQGSGGLSALNQTQQQPAPSLLNQQMPTMQQAPMQPFTSSLPNFNKSGFIPSPALDSLGNPVTQLPSPELPPEFYNQPPILGPDLVTKSSPGMTSPKPQYDTFGRQIVRPDFFDNPFGTAPTPAPKFYDTPTGRVHPGGPGGGISQPGFWGPTPTPTPKPAPTPIIQQTTGVPNPEDYQRMQDYYAQDARNQAEMVRRMQERMGGVQPLLPNMSAPVTQSLPTTTAPKPAPTPGFTAPMTTTGNTDFRNSGSFNPVTRQFTPGFTAPQNRPNPFLGGLSSLLSKIRSRR